MVPSFYEKASPEQVDLSYQISISFLSCIVSLLQNLESISDDLQELSDAWEFQENEIMNSKDKLRSVRAKLAVLEGKMSLAIM